MSAPAWRRLSEGMVVGNGLKDGPTYLSFDACKRQLGRAFRDSLRVCLSAVDLKRYGPPPPNKNSNFDTIRKPLLQGLFVLSGANQAAEKGRIYPFAHLSAKRYAHPGCKF